MDHTAQKDQALAGMGEMAQMLGAYRSQLIEAGFSTEAAEEMAQNFHALYWAQQNMTEVEDG